MSMSSVRRFINSVPDKRVALQLLGALDNLVPLDDDTALTAHAGGGQANALVLRSDRAFHDVATVATAANSVVLPAARIGEIHIVKNSAASNPMQVFAPTPDTINSVATGTGVSQAAGTTALYACVVDGNYVQLNGVGSADVTTPTLNFTNPGTTGNQNINLTANLADALSIKDTASDFAVFVSTTSAKAINVDKATQVNLGASASVTGSGFTLNATRTLAMGVYSDDGNAAISSGTLTRAGRFRNLQTYTGGNREQEAVGLIGQLVSVAGTNRHNMAGLMGSYEASTSLVVDGQNPATDAWIQAGVIGRVGVGTNITTINSNGRLCGVAAMSNTTSFTANNGVYAAFYGGSWGTTVDWTHGLYLEDGRVGTGVYMNTTTKGIGSTVTAVPAASNGNDFYVTVANPNNQSGTSCYFDSTYTGATAGHCYGVGSWINAGASVFSASHIIVPFEGGVYTSGSNANARIVFAGQHQAILNDAPASLHAWRLNTNRTITAMFAAANAGSIGYTAGVAAGTAVGWIAFAEIVGGPAMGYVKIYSATA